MTIHPSTLQLLRFHFSYFLMPVYWFALSFVELINLPRAVLVFAIIHLLVYPSSNGYNSYMDRDTESVGGIANPMQPTRQLFVVTVVMDIMAIALSLLVSGLFAAAIAFYIACSRLYSYRGVRLKQYPLTGYLVVIVNQGAVTFFMVYHGCSEAMLLNVPWQGLVAASFLIGGFYPITQVYQHEADAKDEVKTISMTLGKRGTFAFCAIMYMVAFSLLFQYYHQQGAMRLFVILQLFFVPVIVFFLWWLLQVWKDSRKADFKHTMRMNWLASTCTSLAFITILIVKQFG
ncbi:UbiA family prenyltransferase [Foetidibacter luteolus]|uniref:UbiA family prenyltransferase n=1 Tax=Foetidibacter luteolus TaxID=2608880 RepID=UPI001F303306|nr:UbiA family prenyltransferase [Foetidibacter luteolus]